ncbi:MAG TPA: glycoside hydrolase family 71/99-like protein [Verrucomicrobiae bacterium]|nr:glycoside hydrolase family 71/99-like protein [Verrucomicrobiae bacterium]
MKLPAAITLMLRVFGLAIAVTVSGVPTPTQGAPKPIMVHYMPWYVAKPYSQVWGWHWTMNHFNPEQVDAAGQRSVASHYYPSIGPYDSADPVVLEYHVLLMKLGGIDGVIVDWYGIDNFADYPLINQRTRALFHWVRKAGLKFSLCYEDRTIQAEVSGGYITSANAIAHAQGAMRYAQTNFFTDSSYLQWSNKPVLLNFGPQYFKQNSQWQAIFSVLPEVPAFFAEDNKLPICSGAFNWPPMWLSQTNKGVLTVSALNSYSTSFETKGGSWPAYISSVFPRFHDIYEQANVGSSYGFLDDDGGAQFQSLLRRALTNDSIMVQLVTWNDYGEGTVIEPTVQYGFRDLAVVQNFRRLHVDPQFAFHTNDLTLARRVYDSRRRHAGNLEIAAELDRVFTNIVSGQVSIADLQLKGIESSRPVIYETSITNGLLKFAVGGFVFPGGTEIQRTSNIASIDWETVASYPATTNRILFTIPIPHNGEGQFFKARSSSP